MLSPAVHQALPWAFFTIALISFILRVSIHQRYKRALDRRLLNGDFVALAALLILFAHDVLASRDHRPDLAETLSGLLKRQLPLTLLFTSGLWAVKFEFLYLLYSLVVNLRSLYRAWLCVFAATVFTYLTSLLCYPISTVDCGMSPFLGRFTVLIYF
ncbi:hypothetical protein MPH_12938 [Macrophomina phaseolina MS6]|uniref:Uncharacterized protein n=1 Tax=Macrophomina phaseolina (strain MS6) TaxID=1126212 RepID=K2QJD8_MACPH|nr:hypothetical protein MPH_12938 [Macrophomina phaseolina MS6]